ncbi:MAG: phosphatidylserine decarboxylase family protein [Fidelibacterota bacterium]
MFAPEGRRILIPLLICAFTAGILAHHFQWLWLTILYFVLGLLFLFSLNFFRDPTRRIPKDPKIVISPADGKVVKYEEVDDPEVGAGATLVSIFLNVFNVHVNRVPVTGKIQTRVHQQGKFLAAFNHAASDKNERVITVLENEIGRFKIRQIAGLLARRILCYAEPGKTMQRGERLGYIMFGSRTDLVLPKGINVEITLGQKVIGNETIIARLP